MMVGLDRFLTPIKRKIFLLLGRAILSAVNNNGKTQTLQISALHGETITDIERLQEYGFESYPLSNSSEVLAVFLNGNRDHGLVITVHDRDNRPTDLKEGDTRFYDHRGNKITNSSEGITIESKDDHKVTLESDSITVKHSSGKKIVLNNDNVELLGSDDNAVSYTDLNASLSTFVNALNAALATKMDSPGSPGALSIDISSAKVNEVKVP